MTAGFVNKGGGFMSHILLPVTLITACTLALFGLVLASRVGQGRFKYGLPMGDGGHPDMIVRMRTHANFVEYVPLFLILLSLLELAGSSRTALAWLGGALVLCRILHAVGMPRPAPNIYRAIGAMGTVLLTAFVAVYGLVVAFTA